MSTHNLDCSTQVDVKTLDDDYDMETSKLSGTSDVDSQSVEEKKSSTNGRAEIDTSAPFESVKEAVSRFGGIGFWRPHSQKPSETTTENDVEEVDIAKVEEQAAQLEKDLIVKERETLDVLKELEATKLIVEDLKSKLQKEASEVDAGLKTNSDVNNMNHATQEEEEEKENQENNVGWHQSSGRVSGLCPPSAPGSILMELKQAKLNLSRTTIDLADIRGTVESYNKKLEKERISLEKTRERLTFNSSRISSLEEELHQTRVKIRQTKDVEVRSTHDSPIDISRELQSLSSEVDQFRKMGEAAKLEVSRAMSEIEQTKTRIRTAEIRLVAAKKMKEAARATEAVALAEIKALSNSKNSSGMIPQMPEGVTMSFEEYSSLTCRAREADEASKRRVEDVMLQVDEANLSKLEILKRVEEATEEVKSSKRVLEEALQRVEAANTGKLAVEEALRKWRSEHGQRRRSLHNSTKFKNSYPSHHRRNSHLRDVNGLNLVTDETKQPILRPTLSIGQILSRKLLLTEEFENGTQSKRGVAKRKVSLGQMLSKPNGDPPTTTVKAEKEYGQKQFSAKRKKFGFARFSVLMNKQNKKKKHTPPLNLKSRSGWSRTIV